MILGDVHPLYLSLCPCPTIDLVSVGSYRTNISMTDFENGRQYGAKDNVCMDVAHETQIGGTNGNCIAFAQLKWRVSNTIELFLGLNDLLLHHAKIPLSSQLSPRMHCPAASV